MRLASAVFGMLLLVGKAHGSCSGAKVYVSSSDESSYSVLPVQTDGWNSLHRAVTSQDLEKVKTLFAERDLSTLIDAGDEHRRTPLHSSILLRCPKIARLLLENGASLCLSDYRRMTPLHYAAKVGDTETAEELLTRNVDIGARNKHDNTPLHIAARFGHVTMVQLLLQYNADIYVVNARKQTPLHYAALGGSFDSVALLLRTCAQMKIMLNPPFSTAFERAIHRRVPGNDGVKRLINWRDQDGMTALYYAAERGHDEVINLLQKYSGDAFNTQCQVLVRDAIVASDVNVVRTLARHVDCAIEVSGRAALHYAALHDMAEIASILLENGVDTEFRDAFGRTPLHTAAKHGKSNVLRVLLTKNASMHARTRRNDTPLDLAVRNGHREAVEILSRHEPTRLAAL